MAKLGKTKILPADPVGDCEPCRHRDEERNKIFIVFVFTQWADPCNL